MMKTYTTTKMISKLSNQFIISWVLIIISAILALITFATKGISSFQDLGSLLDSIILCGVGIAGVISSNKKIGQIKGLEFSLGESQLKYKSNSDEITFDLTNPPKSIKKSVKIVEIISQDGQVIKINLDNFKLDYKELKQLGLSIEDLRVQFEKKTTANIT